METFDRVAAMDRDRFRIVLVGARNALNIGAAARAMCNFGFRHLRVVNPHGDPFRDARSAVGAAEVLERAEECATVAEAVADCTLVAGTAEGTRRESLEILRPLAAAAALLRQEARAPATENRNVAILFGSEKTGLTNRDLSHCDWVMRIPTLPEQPSMNLGQAVAVCLYELVRSEEPLHPAASPPAQASHGEMERIAGVLLEALAISGYTGKHPAGDMEERVRQLLRRTHWSAEDASVWLGMMRQMAWKLRQKE